MTRRSRVCAYCPRRGPLTREHILPGFMADFVGHFHTEALSTGRKRVPGMTTIKDVCGPCNNGPLADLDGYGRELMERYFAAPVLTPVPCASRATCPC